MPDQKQLAEIQNLRATVKAAHERIVQMKRSERRATTPMQARYDAVSNANRRRYSQIEVAGETGYASLQLNPFLRLQAIALCRDAIRNFSSARSIMRQIRLNVVGTLYKLSIQGEGGKSAQDWFNKVWAKQCDFRGENHLSDMNAQALESVIRDGDCGMYFDAYLLGTGKMIWYEADQICDLATGDLPPNCTCEDGIIRDLFGRELGYVVNKTRRGWVAVNKQDAFIFWRDTDNPDNNYFKLLRQPWRLNQGRGVPELLTSVGDMLDCYEMRSNELMSGKIASSLLGKVKRDAARDGDFSRPEYDPNMSDADAAAVEAGRTPPYDADANGAATVDDAKHYDRYEAFLGGMMEYMDSKDDFELLDIKSRPNVNANVFGEFVVDGAGASMGMARAYTRMHADGSYTAFRGDMILSWVDFCHRQKWFERQIQDWQAIRAIRWGASRGVCDLPSPGWESRLTWQHPKMPQIDPSKEQEGIRKMMENCGGDLSDQLGPDWREQMDRLQEQMQYAIQIGLPFDPFVSTRRVTEDPAQEQAQEDGEPIPAAKKAQTTQEVES